MLLLPGQVSTQCAAPGFSHRNAEKIGRNDPCPCESGKKYKHCHGAVAQGTKAATPLPPEGKCDITKLSCESCAPKINIKALRASQGAAEGEVFAITISAGELCTQCVAIFEGVSGGNGGGNLVN